MPLLDTFRRVLDEVRMFAPDRRINPTRLRAEIDVVPVRGVRQICINSRRPWVDPVRPPLRSRIDEQLASAGPAEIHFQLDRRNARPRRVAGRDIRAQRLSTFNNKARVLRHDIGARSAAAAGLPTPPAIADSIWIRRG